MLKKMNSKEYPFFNSKFMLSMKFFGWNLGWDKLMILSVNSNITPFLWLRGW